MRLLKERNSLNIQIQLIAEVTFISLLLFNNCLKLNTQLGYEYFKLNVMRLIKERKFLFFHIQLLADVTFIPLFLFRNCLR